MRPRTVELEIGELVLQGLPDMDRDRLVRAMERELSDMMMGWSPGEIARTELGEIDAMPIKIGVQRNEEAIGADIARTVFRGISSPAGGKRPVGRMEVRR